MVRKHEGLVQFISEYALKVKNSYVKQYSYCSHRRVVCHIFTHVYEWNCNSLLLLWIFTKYISYKCHVYENSLIIHLKPSIADSFYNKGMHAFHRSKNWSELL
jgi:hypothetical protein